MCGHCLIVRDSWPAACHATHRKLVCHVHEPRRLVDCIGFVLWTGERTSRIANAPLLCSKRRMRFSLGPQLLSTGSQIEESAPVFCQASHELVDNLREESIEVLV